MSVLTYMSMMFIEFEQTYMIRGFVFCPISIGQGNFIFSPIFSPISSTPILLEPLELRLQQINQ